MGVPSFFRSRGTIIAAAVYVAFSLVCTRLPLLNYLGYEFSALTALLSSFISGLLTISLVRLHLVEQGSVGWRPVRILILFRRGLLLNSALLLLPLLLLSANALLVKNCSFAEGLAFFLLLPVVSVWFSTSLGIFCGVQYRRPKTMFVAIALATFLYALLLGYCTPAIFSYNFLYGYFPGLSYDEILRVTPSLVAFRGVTVVLGGVLIWMSLLIVRYSDPEDPVRRRGAGLLKALLHPRRRVATAAVAAGAALLYFYRCELGFETTAGYLQETLGGRLQTKHCVIYYSPGSVSPEDAAHLAAEHEFRCAQLSAIFSLQELPPMVSYLYPSAEAKRRLIGPGSTNIAKPWRGEVHLAQQSVPSALKHEMAHVVAGVFGMPVIHASLSTGLVEGVAMAVEGSWGNRSLHQCAAAMRKEGLAPDILGLMSFTGFATHSSAVSYVLAGSLCRYLIDSYGMRTLMRVYRTGDYGAAYGRPLPALVAEWERFLGRLRVEQRDREFVDVRFRQVPIFRKVCARVIAAENQQAWDLFDAGEHGGARRLFRDAYGEGGGFESLAGYVASTVRLRDYAAVTVVLDSLVLRDPVPARFLSLYVYFGDSFWALGDTARAASLYERVRQADISENLTEAATVRLLAIRRGEADLAAKYRRYFLSGAPDSLRLRLLDSLFGPGSRERVSRYIRGRVFLRMARWGEAIPVLEPLDFGDTAPELEALRLRSLGTALYELGRYEKARAAFWSSLKSVKTESALLGVTEWIDRCEWMRRHDQ